MINGCPQRCMAGRLIDTGELWREVLDEAEALFATEPILRPLLERHVLTAASPAHSIAGLIAGRLDQHDVAPGALISELTSALESWSGFESGVMDDLAAVRERDPACTTYLHAMLHLKGFQALQAHRIASVWWHRGRQAAAHWLSSQVSLCMSVDIHPAARLASGIMLDHGNGIVIGETAEVGHGASILQGVTLGGTGKERGDRHPKVREGVLIGAGAKILGNIEIGACSKIAAGSVVLRAVPPRCTVAGVPARVVRSLNDGDEGLAPGTCMDQLP